MFKNRSARAANKLAKQQQEQQKASAPKREYYVESKHHRIYCCITCRAHLANNDELISKLFQGNHGRAYLFNKVVNVGCKPAVERELLTGLHAVADIYCESCETLLGWRYTKAFVDSQKYKEGKFILEEHNLLKQSSWDLTSYNVDELLTEHDDEAAEEPSNRKLSRPSIRDRESGKPPTASSDAVGGQSAGLKQSTPDFVVIEVQATAASPGRNDNRASHANGNRIGRTQRTNQTSDNDNETHSSNSVDRSLEREVADRRQCRSLTAGQSAGERGQQFANSSASSSPAPGALLAGQDTLAKRSPWLPFESTVGAADRGAETPSQS